MVRYYGLYANARIHPSPGIDVHRGETAAGMQLRAGRPDGSRGERGVRIDAIGRGGGAWSRLAAFWADPLKDTAGPLRHRDRRATKRRLAA